MRYIRFRAVEDEDYGELGLKPVIPHKYCNGRFTIQNGLTLAHDTIEHQQGLQKIGSIGDEMIALGGVCYTRAQHGEMNRLAHNYYTPTQNLAADITHMAQLYFEGGVPFRQKLVRSRSNDLECVIDDVIEQARHDVPKELEDYEFEAGELDTYLEACRTYMVHGAKLADRRFGSSFLANDLFWSLRDVTNNTVESLEYEGQEFVLGYDFKGNVSFREHYEEAYY